MSLSTKVRNTCSLFLALVGMGMMCSPELACQQALRSWVTDVSPPSLTNDLTNGGRVNALAVNPNNMRVVFAGSELGGVYRTSDGGDHWSHVDDITMFQINDIKYVSRHPEVVIATGDFNGRIESQTGIWRSVDGGVTWERTRHSDPGCTDQPSAYRIASIAAEHGPPQIFVGDDCGIATSTDFGSTWSRLNPEATPKRVWDVEAMRVNGRIQLDVCSDDGYFRSTNAGATGSWTAPDPTPYHQFSFGTPCRVAVAPNDPTTVFLAAWSEAQLWEATGTGAPWSWVPMNAGLLAGPPIGRRFDWVQTHPALDADPTHFEIYFYGENFVVHQTCTTANAPRCIANQINASRSSWNVFDGGAADISLLSFGENSDGAEIAFDPTVPNGCPIYESSDHGVYALDGGCSMAGFQPKSRGLDAFWAYSISGTVLPASTALYMGMQDNGVFSSLDGGTNWARAVDFSKDFFGRDGDVFQVSALNNPLVYLGSGTGEFDGTLRLTGIPAPARPSVLCGVSTHFPGFTEFGPAKYALVAPGQNDCFDHLWLTTDSGQSWSQMGPPLPFVQNLDADYFNPKVSFAAPDVPIFYFQNFAFGNIFRLSGPLDTSATLTEVDAGLQRAARGVFAVSQVDPGFLYASDEGAQQMKFTLDGGQTWQPDLALTNLITHNGAFPYRTRLGPLAFLPNPLLGSQPSAVAFDSTGNTILVGTQTAGIFASFDQGGHWIEIPGSEQIPRVIGFFFDTRTGPIYAGSEGRGIWRIDIPLGVVGH